MNTVGELCLGAFVTNTSLSELRKSYDRPGARESIVKIIRK